MEHSLGAATNVLARGRPAIKIRRPRVGRRAIVATVALAVALGGGWMWFRNSPFTAVEHVQIGGVEGLDAGQIKASLVRAADHMSTLDASSSALMASVSRFRVIKAVRIETSFPHSMRITVVEQLPVAELIAADGLEMAVAADGLEMAASYAGGSLPTIATDQLSGLIAGDTEHQATIRSYLAILGFEPRELLKLTDRIFTGPEGITVAMKDGLQVYFGDDSRPHAKWLSLVAVLSDPSSSGSNYVDVRAPERPAAGTATSGLVGAPDSDVPADSTESLAASLERAVRGESVISETSTSGPSLTEG